MSPWLLVWYLIAAVTTVAVLVFAIALVREALLLGRTARRFQEEAQPIVDDLSRGAARASDRAGSLTAPGRTRP
ncbi:MAG: hypothetical protein ACXWZU_03240 [Actinomycetota bacterium]